MHPFVFPAHSNIIILLLSMFFGRMYPATRCSYQKIILVAGSSNFVFQFNGYFTGQESALSRDRLFSVVEVRPSVMMITTFHAASFFASLASAFFSRNSSRHSASFILALASWSPLRSKKKVSCIWLEASVFLPSYENVAGIWLEASGFRLSYEDVTGFYAPLNCGQGQNKKEFDLVCQGFLSWLSFLFINWLLHNRLGFWPAGYTLRIRSICTLSLYKPSPSWLGLWNTHLSYHCRHTEEALI